MRTPFLLSALSLCALFVLPSCQSVSSEKKAAEPAVVEPSVDPTPIEEVPDEAKTPDTLTPAQRERLEAAELAREKWMRFLSASQSVDDTIRAKEELDKIHAEIADIYKGEDPSANDKESGPEYNFKDTAERKIIYGPIGLVLKFTEWLLEKLYIWRSM